MKARTFTLTTVAILAAFAPSMVEASDRAGPYRKPHWRNANVYDARVSRIVPPVVTIVTPDLSYPGRTLRQQQAGRRVRLSLRIRRIRDLWEVGARRLWAIRRGAVSSGLV